MLDIIPAVEANLDQVPLNGAVTHWSKLALLVFFYSQFRHSLQNIAEIIPFASLLAETGDIQRIMHGL